MADKEKKVSPDSGADKATAEEKAAAKIAKAAKGNSKNDKPNFFVRARKGSKKFFKDFKGECRKIDWPDAKTVLKNTLVVLVVVAIVTAFVFLLDRSLGAGIRQLKEVAVGSVTDGNATDGNVTGGDAATTEAEYHVHEDGETHYNDEGHEEDETDAETEVETEAGTTAAETTEAEAEGTTAEDAE